MCSRMTLRSFSHSDVNHELNNESKSVIECRLCSGRTRLPVGQLDIFIDPVKVQPN